MEDGKQALEWARQTKHTWQIDRYGEIDDTAVDYEEPDRWVSHNGLLCTECGYGFCMWCVTQQEDIDPVCPSIEGIY